ncbi:MAG TPA: acetyl-CoA carboxylase biotin carboxyl carrier protein [Burkholderiales bacterium]|nr:acetyl-CoA carboxylase biotin carboxyl carrier protein [Burkholderiales bacterium]
MSLSHDDVERLLRVLDASHFDELHLETDGTKLALYRRAAPPVGERAAAPVAVATPVAAAGAQAPSEAPQPQTGLVEVRASMLGTFYRAPKPGAEAFVQIGGRVDPETTIGIIEVMKLMNAMRADVAGEVAEILVRDGELVEYDQVLMRVRPL